MKTINVYDPAMCCGSGVCGTDVDQRLVDFQAAIKTVQREGIKIARYNLASDPLAFTRTDCVKSFIQTTGAQGLPVIVVEDTIVLAGRYPNVEELRHWAGANKNAPQTQTNPPISSNQGRVGERNDR